jgi:hypothetical protein
MIFIRNIKINTPISIISKSPDVLDDGLIMLLLKAVRCDNLSSVSLE